jgi:IS66 C-terminal element
MLDTTDLPDDVAALKAMLIAAQAGHDAGAENWATIASLIETCKLNAVDPQAYLTSTITAIVDGHKQSRIDELLPWNLPFQVPSATNDN